MAFAMLFGKQEAYECFVTLVFHAPRVVFGGAKNALPGIIP
jgi:hypothetical protein